MSLPIIALIGEIRRRDDGRPIPLPRLRARIRGAGPRARRAPRQHPVRAVGLAAAADPIPLDARGRPRRHAEGRVRHALVPSERRDRDGRVRLGARGARAPRCSRRRIFLQEQNARLGAANRFLAQFAGTRRARRSSARCASAPRRAGSTSAIRFAARSRTGRPGRGARALRHPGGSDGRLRRRREHGLALDQPRHGRGAQDRAQGPEGLRDPLDGPRRDARLPRIRRHVRAAAPARALDPDIPGRYACRRFIDDIQDVYALADLVVARSGAGTIMELGAIGKASLLDPEVGRARRPPARERARVRRRRRRRDLLRGAVGRGRAG